MFSIVAPPLSQAPGTTSRPRAVRTHRRSIPAAWMVILVVSVLLPGNRPAAAQSPPAQSPPAADTASVQWRDLSLDAALAEAGEKNTMVLVDVWAAHCHSCGDMDIEIWQTPEGVALAEGLIPIKIDTQTPAGREFMKRYPVTGLPVTIILEADGTELDRVEGYVERSAFLRDSRSLQDRVDPLPAMEALLRQRPDDLPLLGDLLERYLFRKRLADADSAYQRILRLDADNSRKSAEKAISKMARFEENYTLDYAKAASYYQQLAERFPDTPAASGGVNGVHKALLRAGRSREWVDWICPLLERHPQAVQLQRAAAMTAWNNGFRTPCFAGAARVAARDGGRMAAFLDSIAVIMEAAPEGRPK